MTDWLRRELAPYRHFIAEACLFGSVLDPTREPRDIDLVLVTTDGADGPAWQQNTERAVRYCLEHPRWRLSLQTHKLLGIP